MASSPELSAKQYTLSSCRMLVMIFLLNRLSSTLKRSHTLRVLQVEREAKVHLLFIELNKVVSMQAVGICEIDTEAKGSP